MRDISDRWREHGRLVGGAMQGTPDCRPYFTLTGAAVLATLFSLIIVGVLWLSYLSVQ